jgi:hypothetical protein
MIIRYSDDLSTPTVPAAWCTSSRFEEVGMASAWGKRIVIVSGVQSLFDRLPNRIHVADTEVLLAYLTEEQRHLGYVMSESDEGTVPDATGYSKDYAEQQVLEAQEIMGRLGTAKAPTVE